ncbi:MAG: NADH-quinone oxidoreductase subunit A [Coriobacteriia bacterium]|nr:NADH-quinone oxidoreductase subunit A [Coriobacteriia bacterium]
MLNDILLTPPVVFVVVLAVVTLLALLSRGLAVKSKPSEIKNDPYACGQEVSTGRIQPGYNFFHIAFIFTILEVTALLLATFTSQAFYLIAVVLSIIALALIILFRKD